MQRKIFVAIELDEKAKIFIDKKVDEIKKELDFRSIDKQNYHITLSFLGYVEDERLMEMISKIAKALKEIEIFDIHLNKIILAPDNENPKMIWLIGEKNEALIEVRHKIEQAISAIEIKKLEFRPHINLGKIKGTETKKMAIKKIDKIEKNINLLIPTMGVKVFESKIEKRRQRYLPIDSIEFN